MNIIYSDNKIEGLKGAYASPSLFKECDNCELVYTDDAEIKKAYEAKGVKVAPLTAKKPKAKTEKK